jgi:hypothetical protein
MKLSKSGYEVVLKDDITRGELKKYEAIMTRGAKSTANGNIDQASLLSNIQEQKDQLILLWVDTIDGNKPTLATVEGLFSADYKELHEACAERHGQVEEKKS